MKYLLFFLLASFFCTSAIFAQNSISGTLVDSEENTPLVGAKVHWLGTILGTQTDADGRFELPRHASSQRLVTSYFGYQNDTIEVGQAENLRLSMRPDLQLEAVEIEGRQAASSVAYLNPMKTEWISEKELLKAACCNLSESFETNPSVDVAFTDAVTGTRQIQLLGLAGPYTQITQENMPGIRGFSSMYGLTHTPGTWVENMQLNKGAGSVVNGFESIAGQINVELRKPETAERLYLNLYVNEGRRVEANANFAHRFNDNWSTALLIHAKQNGLQVSHTEAAFMDRNGDNFMDMPMSQQFIGMNRWKYIGDGRLRVQAGVKGIYIDQIGGELSDHNMTFPHNHFWAMQLNTRRLEGFSKIGLVFPQRPWRSVGLQVSAVNHEQDSYFGLRRYWNQQRSTYANLVYQGILGNTNHTFRTGASFQADWYEEQLNVEHFDRNEIVPGAYFEYTYQHLDKFGLVAGLRADHHNLFGAFVTPRLHLRYVPREKTVFRLSGGRGQRTANILAENNGLFASARQIVIQGEEAGLPYGLRPEVAWNLGFNFTQYFTLDYREGSFTLDVYRTDFENQIVMDLENPREARFYNLDGQSYSNSFQAQLDYELVKRVDVRMAYRWFDVNTTYSGELLAKPLVSPHRAFINVAYETRSDWTFDYTLNWQGSKRLPNTSTNPEQFQRADRSPAFVLMNAQVSKKWGEHFELYLGGENLLNFKQNDPIVAAADPFGPYFDASMVWGPIFGRVVYLGLRYRVE